jgi:hypothetical protein
MRIEILAWEKEEIRRRIEEEKDVKMMQRFVLLSLVAWGMGIGNAAALIGMKIKSNVRPRRRTWRSLLKWLSEKRSWFSQLVQALKLAARPTHTKPWMAT